MSPTVTVTRWNFVLYAVIAAMLAIFGTQLIPALTGCANSGKRTVPTAPPVADLPANPDQSTGNLPVAIGKGATDTSTAAATVGKVSESDKQAGATVTTSAAKLAPAVPASLAPTVKGMADAGRQVTANSVTLAGVQRDLEATSTQLAAAQGDAENYASDYRAALTLIGDIARMVGLDPAKCSANDIKAAVKKLVDSKDVILYVLRGLCGIAILIGLIMGFTGGGWLLGAKWIAAGAAGFVVFTFVGVVCALVYEYVWYILGAIGVGVAGLVFYWRHIHVAGTRWSAVAQHAAHYADDVKASVRKVVTGDTAVAVEKAIAKAGEAATAAATPEITAAAAALRRERDALEADAKAEYARLKAKFEPVVRPTSPVAPANT